MPGNLRKVILYGDSLILVGVRASLVACPDLEIHELNPSSKKKIEAIRDLCPAVFIFDLGAVQLDFQLSLLQQPGLLLVGVAPETHQAVVWSGRQAAAVNAADLLNVIHRMDTDSETVQGGNAKRISQEESHRPSPGKEGR